MNIQSAGRLGNILFIWAFALKQKSMLTSKSITVFVDRFHTNIDIELLDTFHLLDEEGVKFRINNRLGLLLKVLDKISSFNSNLGNLLKKYLRISTEGQSPLDKNAWILRGYFQKEEFPTNTSNEIFEKLDRIVELKANEGKLKEKFPFLNSPYQAIHIRLTDYIGSEYGVVDPHSQLKCLEENLKVIICTDGKKEEIASRIDITGIEVITSEHSSAWETLSILSNSKNLITSNSTLSWWSGFLATFKGNNVWIPLFWNSSHSLKMSLPSGAGKTYLPKFE
jgi:hypothetical protein